MNPATTPTRSSEHAAPNPHLGACATAIANAWQAIQLYGVDHASGRTAVQACVDSWRDACTAGRPLSLRITPTALELRQGEPAEPVAAPALREACSLLNVIAIDAPMPPSTQDIVALFEAIDSAHRARRTGAESPPIPREVGPFRLTVLSLAGLRTADEHVGGWDDLVEMMLHPERAGAAPAGELLEGLATRAAERPGDATRQLAGALRQIKRADVGTGGAAVSKLRESLAALSPELRRQLIQANVEGAERSVDDFAEVAEVLPLAETCEALASLDRTNAQISGASLRLVRRLAGLALSEPGNLQRVADLAETWSARPSGDQAPEGAFQTLADLCREASRADFIPEEYEARLEEIAQSAGSVSQRANRVTTPDETDDDTHAAEILLDVVEGSPSPDDAEGVLARLAAVLPAIIRAGRPDLVCRGAAFARAHPSSNAADPADASDPRSMLTNPGALTDAIAHCRSESALRGQGGTLLAAWGGSPTDLVAAILASKPTPAARHLARDLVREALDATGLAVLAELGSRHPTVLRDFEDLIAALGPDGAFDVVRASLAGSNGRADDAVFAVAEMLPFRWPDTLILRALINTDPRVRAAGVRHVVSHAPEAAPLVFQQLAGAHAEAAPDHDERAEWIHALERLEANGQTSLLSRAFRLASSRPTRAGAIAAAELWAAMKRGPAKPRPLDHLIRVVSPARSRALVLRARKTGGVS